MTVAYPFTAIVGQDDMKLALAIAAVDPGIGGVLVFGERGTGKSTTIRALAQLLPKISAVKSCPYNCDPKALQKNQCPSCQNENNPKVYKISIPVVDLPLGATEDRVLGALDIEKAIHSGERAFQPGLLAAANRGFLYIDEVNLLEDHIVDALLDVAASGVNVVEREGLSIRHPARFVLVGSGNPEEGELRPQLLDRFGMHAEIRTIREPDLRVRIVEERISFDVSPQTWFDKYDEEQNAIQARIVTAQNMLSEVSMNTDFQLKISQVCSALEIEGLRGDIVSTRAAKALAAFENRTEVTLNDIERTITLCLRHRLRRDPMETISTGDKVSEVFKNIFSDNQI